jgi:ribosomal protein S18 acetylase RimI-like enzyme
MSAPSVAVIRRGGERARTAPWRGAGDVALINPTPEAPFLSGEFVTHCLRTLAGQGFRRVVTGALSPLEQAGFLAAGFGVEATLALLGRDLGPDLPPVPAGFRLVRVRRHRRGAVLAVDHAAFSEFWRFDELGLSDALSATPAVRFRAARTRSGRIVGYAISGRSGTRGFVQRLAVHPDAHRTGTGRRLLLDGLHWMRRQGATRAVVNTQSSNHPALSLYSSVGFSPEPIGLSVLSAGLP